MNQIVRSVVAAIAVAFSTGAAGGEIDGVVRDVAGAPAEGVVVTIEVLDLEVRTDDHGHFHFDDVPAGRWRVSVDDGPTTATREVEVGEGLATVNLSVGVRSFDRIVVHATPLRGRSPLDMARPVTVLSGDDLTRKTASSIGDTIAGELGVSATSFGAGASRPVIRGLGDDRVRILQGGIGTLDVSSVSDDHGVTIEPILVDQIEILRGPATLLYGTGAIGGVVNVIDSRIPERTPAHAFEGRTEMRGGSVDNQVTGVVRFDGRAGDALAWHVDGFRRSTGDYDIPGFAESAYLRGLEADEGDDHEQQSGTLPNSALEHRGGGVGFSWIGDEGFIGAAVSFLDNRYGIPGGHAHGSLDEEPVTIAQEQVRFDLSGAHGPLRYRLGINDYEHREIEGRDIGTVFTNDAWEGRAEYTREGIAGWDGAVGVQASVRDFAAIGDEAFTPPVESRETGLFAVGEREYGRVKIELGARVERVRHDPATAASRSVTLKSASAGVIVTVGEEVDLTLNVGRYQRAPVAEELFSDGPHLATATFELGDPALRHETSKAVEIGIRDGRGDLRWSLTAYRNDFDAFIHQADTGFEDADSGLPVFRYTQQDAVFSGFEAEIIGVLAEGDWGRLDGRLFGDSVTARFNDGSRVPRLPPRRNGAALAYTHMDWSAQLTWARHADQDAVAALEAPTPGYDMVDAEISRRLDIGTSGWIVFARASNLLDEDARRHTSFLKELVPLPGRGIELGARIQF